VSTDTRIWSATTGQQIAVLDRDARVNSASFSPDGRRIVTASKDNTARIWDVATRNQITVLRGHSDGLGGINSALFSPDGQRIVTASGDHTARLWDATTGTQLAVLEGHVLPVFTACFSRDGQWIVTASFDYTARIWNASTGKQINALGHNASVESATFSPDGHRILTASEDSTACIWDTKMGRIVLQGHTGGVMSAAFSPDGRRIVTASQDSTARVWDVSRSAAMERDAAVALTAALARGVGWRTNAERTDLLMQDAPEDLYVEARRQLLNLQEYSPEQIARREQLLDRCIAELRAPLHPNCYLSPSQFAEKFNLSPPPASPPTGAAQSANGEAAAEGRGRKAPSPAVASGANDSQPAANSSTGSQTRDNSSTESSTRWPPHQQRAWVLWLTLGWAAAVAAVASLSAFGALWR
jgi:hypothetical protein